MVSVHQIRLRLADWISGKVSLADFEDWFVPATWNIQKAGDEDVESLVDEIELNLSEYSGGYLSKQQLRDVMISTLASISPISVIDWQPVDAIRVPAQSLSMVLPRSSFRFAVQV